MQKHLMRQFTGLLVLFLAPVFCFSQVDRAGLSGTVTDISGKVIPGARVTALQTATNLVREAVSSTSGIYFIPELPSRPLPHSPSAVAGFGEFVIEDVAADDWSHKRTLDFTLAVGEVTQQVNVSGQTAQLDETTDTLGARTESEQVKDLPLNGRNWSTLTALVPGAVDTGGSNQRSIRFAGRGLDDNNFTYDGIDATNIVNQAQQAFVRLAIPTDAIRGVSHRYDAVYSGKRKHPRRPGGRGLEIRLEHSAWRPVRIPAQRHLRCPRAHPSHQASVSPQPVRRRSWAAGSSATAASSTSPMKDCARVMASRSQVSSPPRHSPLRWPRPIRRWRRSSPPIQRQGWRPMPGHRSVHRLRTATGS